MDSRTAKRTFEKMKELSEPFVSVIIPVYNDVERLKICLQALEAQTDPLGSEGADAQSIFDFSQGSLVQTDRRLDFALYGKGFFVLESPDGPLYTRHGIF